LGLDRNEANELFELLERSKAIERPPQPKKRKIGFLVKEGAARYGRAYVFHFEVSRIPETWKLHKQN